MYTLFLPKVEQFFSFHIEDFCICLFLCASLTCFKWASEKSRVFNVIDRSEALKYTEYKVTVFQKISINHLCNSPISISMNVASSGRARGSTPGSLKLVLSNMAMTKRKSRAAKTGMAGDRWTARYGHLWEDLKKNEHKV